MKEPIWIDERDALALHGRMIGLEGGPDGIRDLGLLSSALARPRQFYTYREAADVVEMAAAYTVGIVRNHPFVDGNKRTGFLAGVLFLELNGYRFFASEESAAHAVMALASGDIDEPALVSWMRANAKRLKS